MKDTQYVILTLLEEIHKICRENDIKYFLANRLALAVYKESNGEINDGLNFDTGKILMTAKDMKKFLKIYKSNKKYHNEHRTLEWLGSNENFPGVFLRYIDLDTVYYTPNRLLTEKHLGMFIIIDVLRPLNKRTNVYQALENAWRNFTHGYVSGGKKLEPVFRKVIESAVVVFGKKRIAGWIHNFLMRRYDCLDADTYFTQKENTKGKHYFTGDIFKASVENKLMGCDVYTCEKLGDYIGYGYRNYQNTNLNTRDAKMNFFCDAELSYRQLNLFEQREAVKDVLQKIDRERKAERPYKNKRKNCFDLMMISYYRYYYAFHLLKKAELLEEWYQSGNRRELDEKLMPYVKIAQNYAKSGRSLFIDNRLSELVRKCYGIDTDKLFRNTMPIYKKGLPVYDYKGEYIETMGEI